MARLGFRVSFQKPLTFLLLLGQYQRPLVKDRDQRIEHLVFSGTAFRLPLSNPKKYRAFLRRLRSYVCTRSRWWIISKSYSNNSRDHLASLPVGFRKLCSHLRLLWSIMTLSPLTIILLNSELLRLERLSRLLSASQNFAVVLSPNVISC